MRLTTGKINDLANQILDLLRADDSVEFYAEDREIRKEITNVINKELEDDERIDQIVRRRIESHRNVQQGTENWDLLYRRLYDEEMIKSRRWAPGEEREE